MKKLSDAFIEPGTNVLVRGDLDVPLKDSNIEDTYRLDKLLPTLNYLVEKGAKITIIGHMGRPEGKFDKTLSTDLLRPYFDQHLGTGTYTLLENLRFDAREEEGSEEFATELSTGIDLYVNDSFAACHRNHTSIMEIPKLVPSYAGIRLEQEVENLTKIITNPQRPLIGIVGGAKIETKKPVINSLLKICDTVLVGGKIWTEWHETVPDNLILPVDYTGDKKDIGPETIKLFTEKLIGANTVVWGGPLGYYVQEEFSIGTTEIAKVITNNPNVFSVIGGGDTITAIKNVGLLDKISFVSTGGGAMLEFLVNKTLPGLEALK